MTGLLAIFGGMHGFLTHLRLNGMTLKSPGYLSTNFARLTFVPCVGGMAVAGAILGMKVYGDEGLLRLHQEHRKDRAYNVASAKYVPRSQ